MGNRIHLGILETGRPPEELNGRFSDYPDMFSALLQSADPEIDCTRFAALDGEVPSDPRQCDAWLITGSKFGAYEDHTWIPPLEQLIRDAYEASVPMLGICFGHQIMAQALGGKVEKSERGWGLGITNYPLIDRPPWLDARKPEFRINAYHQDQVTQLPAGARVLASTAFCPYAALSYGTKGLSFQGHPEFDQRYTKQLLKLRRGQPLPEPLVDAAMQSIDGERDSQAVARWMVDFLRHSLDQPRD